MNTILYDRAYTDSYLAIKEARVIVTSALDGIMSGHPRDGLRHRIEQALTVARRVSAAQRRLALRTRDASDVLPAAEAASELDLLQRTHMQRSRPDAPIGPAEMEALERAFKRLLLMIVEMVNAMIRMIARVFGVDLPLIDDAPIRTAIYGNDDYRRAKHGDASLVQAAGDIMQRDYAEERTASAVDPAPTWIARARQVRGHLSEKGGPSDLIDDSRRAYLDELTADERSILAHASSNQLVEHLYLQTSIDGVRPFPGRRVDTMTI